MGRSFVLYDELTLDEYPRITADANMPTNRVNRKPSDFS
jgi:hypothetical protein